MGDCDELQEEGHLAFEPFVESLFPDLKRIGFESYSEYLDMPERTTEAWKNGADVVSQGRYEYGSITCISDLVRRDGDKLRPFGCSMDCR